MARTYKRGAASPRWRGGRFVTDHGYVRVYAPEHPAANPRGYAYEHIVLAVRALGRPLPIGAQVHHVNKRRDDNGPGNLVICQDATYHRLLHIRADALEACGNPDYRRCALCGRYDDPAQLAKHRRAEEYKHRACAAAYLRRWHAARRGVRSAQEATS